MEAMTQPAPAPPTPSVGERVAARFDLSDRRNLIGLGVLCFCAGVMVGARLMRGAVPPVQTTMTLRPPGAPPPFLGGNPGPPIPPFDVPCAGCRERMIQEQRAFAAAASAQRVADATDDNTRADVADRQQLPPEGMRTFSPYAESVLPADLVNQGDSALPPEQQ